MATLCHEPHCSDTPNNSREGEREKVREERWERGGGEGEGERGEMGEGRERGRGEGREREGGEGEREGRGEGHTSSAKCLRASDSFPRAVASCPWLRCREARRAGAEDGVCNTSHCTCERYCSASER